MRVLLSVGCDNYLHIAKLGGAVKDAKSVFSALVGNQEHQYDMERSKLLLSPNAECFRKTLSEVLYNSQHITVFTLFFAGHAAVCDETLYLAFEDTLSDRIPATAIGFPEVLRTTAGARPKQANFIVDACNAAGLGFDIGSILKRTIVGNSDTMGISFVASAAAEQSATESEDGGRFTIEFAKTLRGDVYVQQARPFLNLAEIAQQVQVSTSLGEQAISYWTLNLQGPNLFAKNPHFSGPSHATDKIVSQLQKQRVSTGADAADFKSAIAKITNGINERTLSKTLGEVFSKIETDQRCSLIYGLIEGLRIELAGANDPFLEARIQAVLLGQILGLCPANDRNLVLNDLIGRYVAATRQAIAKLSDSMALDRNALLVDSISDLYELPIRISDIFGQCALLFFGQREVPQNDSNLVLNVVRNLLHRYGNSILALTDDQATGYLLFLEVCRRENWSEFSEEVIGRLYHDLHRNFARCGAYSLNAKSQFELLSERYLHSLSVTRDLYNFPSDLTSVILSFAALGSLDEAVDSTLIEIDHTSVNYFVPDTLDRFGLVDALEGANYTQTLGRDFWRCIDLRRILIAEVFPKYRTLAQTMSWEDNFCSLASALALRDRLPWHVVEGEPATVTAGR
jgi:caspase domain-containing protein